MSYLVDQDCRKCGGSTSISWTPSSGMDIEKTGMKRTCRRCGFSEFISTLDEKNHIDLMEEVKNGHNQPPLRD